MSVAGTPADCVRLALHHLVPRPSWVLAGINAGGNLGTDIHHSGTVAAVREAVIHGVPGIALSHIIARGRAIDWTQAGGGPRRSSPADGTTLGPGTFWNVNFPHLEPGQPDPEVVFCPLDPSPLPLRYRVEGDVRLRRRLPVARSAAGGDVAMLFRRQDRRDLDPGRRQRVSHAQSAADELSRESLRYRRTVGLNRKSARGRDER